jgi:hypothetical protein
MFVSVMRAASLNCRQGFARRRGVCHLGIEAAREAKGAGSIPLWRNTNAVDVVTEYVGPIVPPIALRAMEILKQASAWQGTHPVTMALAK